MRICADGYLTRVALCLLTIQHLSKIEIDKKDQREDKEMRNFTC